MSSSSCNPNSLKKSPLALALTAALILPLTAYAQSTADDQAETTKEVKEETTSSNTTTLNQVTVTGSRIAKDTFN